MWLERKAEAATAGCDSRCINDCGVSDVAVSRLTYYLIQFSIFIP